MSEAIEDLWVEVGRFRALGEAEQHALVLVASGLESRIIPILPYGLVNFSAGLTHLSYRDMALGTLIGAAPKVYAYTALGGSLGNLGSPEAITAIALLVILGIAGALFVRFRLNASRRPREPQGTPPPA